MYLDHIHHTLHPLLTPSGIPSPDALPNLVAPSYVFITSKN